MRVYRALDLATKAALFALLALDLVLPDLQGIKANASLGRLVLYPLGVLVVPIGWWVRGLRHRRRAIDPRIEGPKGFPWAADLLISLPWLLDTLGNRFGLFESIGWWDKMMHFLNWMLLTGGLLLAWRFGRRTAAGVVVMVALGFGCTAALAWELLEYASFNRLSNIPGAIYVDTLGDLSAGTLGSLTAALIGLVIRRVVSRAGQPTAHGRAEQRAMS